MSTLDREVVKSKRKRNRYPRTVVRSLKSIGETIKPCLLVTDISGANKPPGNNEYSPHWSYEDLISGIRNGTLLSGSLRINPRNFEDGYIKHPSGDSDVYISTLASRNRGLPNDIVAVMLEPKRNWRVFDSFIDESFREAEDPKQKKKFRYVTLEEFLKIQPTGLEKVLGSHLAQKIVQDLNSSSDPIDSSASGYGTQTYASWWSIIQRTGHVVGIIQPLHSRAFIGNLQIPRNSQTPKKMTTKVDQNSDSTNSACPIYVNKPEVLCRVSTVCSWKNAVLTPTDTRLPRVFIPREVCPEGFQKNPKTYKNVRFIGRITEWPDSNMFPQGELLRELSCDSSNLIQDETDRILVGAGFIWGVDAAFQFPDDVTESVRQSVDYVNAIYEKDSAFRKDFRKYCVFTIDPSNARDLDDALHIRNLEPDEIEKLESSGYRNAFYEVGVHIADVSYFVKPESPVDKEAASRATSIYLVHLCVPMLPRMLCEEECSLNPGEDKFAFSVVFTVTIDAKILTTWFGRTRIRSCCKLSYEDAQEFIDHPGKKWTSNDCIKVEQPYTVLDVCNNVLILNNLATEMRRNRFQSGALRLDQVKPSFSLDSNKLPLGITPYISKQSNWLIEEWMLAANKSVAEHLAKSLPDSAFLRRHPPPSGKQLTEVSANLKLAGMNINVDSAGSIQSSICHEAGCKVEVGYHYSDALVKLCNDFISDSSILEANLTTEMEILDLNPVVESEKLPTRSLEHEARLLVTVTLLTKAMNLAVYFCLGLLPSGLSPEHYALNMQLYTHFTSPIRRYADVIVHRQLSATLAKEEDDPEKAAWYLSTAFPKEMTSVELQKQAEVCNSKKLSARIAGEESAELFFILFVKEAGPFTEVCAVTAVLDRSFDVLILSCGLTRRVYLQNLNLKSYEFIPPQTSMGKITESGKLRLSWNRSSLDTTKTNNLISGDYSQHATDDSKNTLPSCGCFYTEIRLFDVVRCSVSIDSCQSANDVNQNTRQNTYVPKLLVTLLRSTCKQCHV
ncbi:DIS3-like exonuclease 2 [Schistosoma japonicum]|nr:DIS3-like exonuclease 2 [Schistosoma japonicum]